MTGNGLRIAIRADAAHWIGFGHIARCASLAEDLKANGAQVEFICRELPGHYGHWLEHKGFSVHLLPTAPALIEGRTTDRPKHVGWLGVPLAREIGDTCEVLKRAGPFDWLIVDHYALDKDWENAMSPYARKLMVIDDLADRPHQCALLLDQNYYQNADHRYDGLLPADCRKLIGPGFTLLRNEFTSLRKRPLRDRKEVRKILVSFGGSDTHNVTTKVLDAITPLIGEHISLDVTVGANHTYREMIVKRFSSRPGLRLHIQTEQMAALIASADLAIGSCGVSTWERCCAGLPTIVLITAENQQQATEDLAQAGAIINLGYAYALNDRDILASVQALIGDSEKRALLSERCLNIMAPRDGSAADHIK